MTRNVLRRNIQWLLWIVLLSVLVWKFVGDYGDMEKSIITPEQLWNTNLDIEFTDEPAFDISESDVWTIPSDPEVIRPIEFGGLFEGLLGGIHISELTEEEIDEKWKESDIKRLRDFVSKHGLEESYYEYFYTSMRTPLNMIEADVTGDGEKEKLFMSSGVGCISCHPVLIDIVSDSLQFEVIANKGGISPRQDGKGFYIENQYTGDELATCCADNIVISRYEWNGKGFTETARKKADF